MPFDLSKVDFNSIGQTPDKPTVVPSPQPVNDSINVVQQAINQYPILKNYDIQSVNSYGKGNDAELEFWPPGEPGSSDYQRPSTIPMNALGIQLFNQNVTPKDVLADVTSHYLIHHVPKLEALYNNFVSSITPEQQNRLKKDYIWAQKNENEKRPFDQWVKTTRLPAYFRGYTFNQWSDSFNNKFFTPEQINLFNQVRQYLGMNGQQNASPMTNVVHSNMSEAVKINPDQHAEAMKLSQGTGVPVPAVNNTTKQQFDLNKVDFNNIDQTHPKTAGYLSNFDNAVVAQDDVPILKSIENWFNFGKTFQNFSKTTGLGFEKQAKGAELGLIDKPTSFSLTDQTQHPVPGNYGPMATGISKTLDALDWLTKSGTRSILETFGIKPEQINQHADNLVSQIKNIEEQRQELTPKDLSTFESTVRGGVDMFTNMLPAMAALGITKNPTVMNATFGAQTYGESYGTCRAHGGLSASDCSKYAAIDSAIVMAAGATPTSDISKALFAKTALAKELGLKEGFKQYIGDFVKHQLVGMEMMTLGTSLNAYAFGLDAELNNPDLTAGQKFELQLKRQATTAFTALIATAGQAGLAGIANRGMRAVAERQMTNEAKGNIEQSQLNSMNELAKDSKLHQRDKELFRQFVKDADGGDGTSVYIDGPQTALYLQNKTQAEIAKDPALRLLNEKSQEARQLGQDVQIPVEDFATDIAGTEHFNALRDSMTMSPETVAPFRQEQVRHETQTYINQLMDEANQHASDYKQAVDIYNNVRDQLINSGTVTPQNASVMAQIVPAWATAKAAREGKTVQQVYEENGFSVVGPHDQTAASAGAMEQPAYKDAPALYKKMRDDFLERLPEDANAEEVAAVLHEFSPEQQSFLKQMEKNDWLGFDYPSQAIDAVLSENQSDYELSASLKTALGKMVNKYFGWNEAKAKRNNYRQEVINLDSNLTNLTNSQALDAFHAGKELKLPIDQAEKLATTKPDEAKVASLKEKIQNEGLKNPVEITTNPQGKIELADGHHRIEALKQLGYKEVPVKLDQEYFQTGMHQKLLDQLGVKPEQFAQSNLFPESNRLNNINKEGSTWKAILNKNPSYRGEDKVKIYRATIGNEIRNNDFVAINHDIAKEHLKNLKERGEKGKIISKTVNSSDLLMGNDATEFVYSPEQFAQGSQKVARGYYDPANSIIRLTKAADLSTFLHEFAHFMYEMEVKGNTDILQKINQWNIRNADAVAKEANSYLENKNSTITSDEVSTYLNKGTTEDSSKDVAIRRAVHEQFARGFETYLMEGKAPSIELRNAFRTMARWLVQLYQSIRGNLNVNLDKEMRQVFDRLLATEDQIQAAEARAHFAPMFTDATMVGMTEEEFAKYKQQQQRVKDVETETLRDKLIKEITRQTEDWWKTEKSDLVDQEIEKLKTDRVNIARERLKSGEIKLNRDTIRQQYGETRTNKLGKTFVNVPKKLNKMTDPMGLHPDEAAPLLGYNSGSELVRDLLSTPSLKDQANAAAEKTMLARHGDILHDGSIEAKADEAVTNEERGKLLLTELKTLRKGTYVPNIDRTSLKAFAKDNIGKLNFREINPGKYRKAEIRAAQESMTAFHKGDKEAAAQAKMKQIINYYLGMEAMQAKNDTVKIVDRMARYNKKKVREQIARAGNDYLDQIDKILSRFEFRKSATLKEVENLNLWMKDRIENYGDGLVLANAVLDEGYMTHWKNVPFSDLQGVNDSVKNIEHVARYSNKVKLQQEEHDYQKLKSDWIDSIKTKVGENYETKSTRSRLADAEKAGALEHVRRWNSQLTKIPMLAAWLDGGERIGMTHDIMVQPFTDALDAKLKLFNEIAKPVIDMISHQSKEDMVRHNTKIFIPEINDNLMGHQILAVALNTGNEGNLKKLLLGEGWASPDSPADISFDNPKLQAVLKHMTRGDWEFVQKTWDQMEKLYPQLAAVHERTTGLTPPKVEATPHTVLLADGSSIDVKGGYYPVKYSPKRSHKAERNAERRDAETESLFNNTASIQASVNAGATNARTGFYDRIQLSLNVIPDHFNEVIHYITHHDAVRQVNRLINDPEIANAITAAMGEAEYKELKPWLNDIAKDGRMQPTKTFIDEWFNRLRLGTTLGVMGFKANTGIMQLFGLLTTAGEVGLGPTVKGIYTTIGRSWYLKHVQKILGSTSDMQTGWDFASERSKVMNHRMQTLDREIKSAMERLQNKRGWFAAVQEASMQHIALIQTYMVDLPTWHAAYDKMLSETGNEARAIKYADWAVENLQGSGATKDLPRIMRNQSKLHTTMTMFMTYFSSLNQLLRDTGRGARLGQYSPAATAAKLMFLVALPVFIDMLIHGDLAPPQNSNEDDRLKKFMLNTALYPISTIPFVRDVASGLLSDYGYNSSPVSTVLEKGIDSYKTLYNQTVSGNDYTESAVKNSAKLTGVIFGIPGTGQMWNTGEHLYDVAKGNEDLTLHELLFGPDYKK